MKGGQREKGKIIIKEKEGPLKENNKTHRKQ